MGPILLPYPGLFDFILSFPLLEDLGLTGYDDSQFNDDDPHGPQNIIPSTSPPLTGSLHFHLRGVRQLLDLPDGLHFKSLTLSWVREADLWWITELVTRCSHSLEFLDIFCTLHRTFIPVCIRTNNSTLFKLTWRQVHTSRQQQNSAIWFFDPDRRGRMDHHGTSEHHT